MKKLKKYLSICIAVVFILYAVPLNITFMGKNFSNNQVVKATTGRVVVAEDVSIDNNAQWGHGQEGIYGMENYVGSNTSNALLYERSAIKFDLTGIPAAADISAVNLKLYIGDVQSTTPGYPVVSIMSAADNSWSENTGNGTFPKYNGSDVTAINGGMIINGLANQTITATGWKSFDITQYIKEQYTAGNRYVTIVLTGQENNGDNDFGYVCNDQYDPNVPYLDFAYTTDGTPPAVGNSGTITANNATSNSVDLSWTAATDSGTPTANLQYKVVRSENNDINTVANAEGNGTMVQDWSANLTSKKATGLSADTTYYFNVIAKDAAGNKSLYTIATQTTLGALVIINGSSVAGLTAGNTTITGLNSSKSYTVQIKSGSDNGKYVNATGIVGNTSPTTITSVTGITGLVNGTTYEVLDVTPTAVIVNGSSVAGLTAGNTTITGLNSSKSYTVQIKSGSDSGKYVNATGVVGTTTPVTITSATGITGLVNGTTYEVLDVTPTAVIVDGSSVLEATAGNAIITGLNDSKTYTVQIMSGSNSGKYVNATGLVGTTTPISITGEIGITGLINGTTYKVLDITPTVPTATTGVATSVTSTTATLNGTVNDNRSNTGVTFQYGISTAYGSVATATPNTVNAGSGSTSVSAAISGLTPNTTYHFRVRGLNGVGNTNGNDATFTTSAASTDATLSALSIGGGSLNEPFASETTNYTANVANGVTSIIVTPTVHESHARVTVAGASVNSGQGSNPIFLNEGANPISVVVTAQDGTTKDYTITVTREASPTAPATFIVSTATTGDNLVNDDGKSSVTVTWTDSATATVDHYDIVAKVGSAPAVSDTVTGKTNIGKTIGTATFDWNAGDNLYVGVVAVDTNGLKTLCTGTTANVTVAADGHTPTAPATFTVNQPTSIDNGVNDDGKSSVSVTWTDSATGTVDHYEIVAKAGSVPSVTDTVTGQTNIAKGTSTATLEWSAGVDLYVGVVAVDTNGLKTLCSGTPGNVTVAADGHTATALVIDTTNPPAGTVGVAYSGFNFNSSGGTGTKSYAVTSGSLPAGLSLAADGTLTGTPTTSSAISFTVTVTDSAVPPVTDSYLFTMTINAPATFSLTYTAGANGSITGTTSQAITLGDNGTAVTAVPKAGYHFVSWSDGVVTATRIDRNITNNINVTANFAADVISGGGGGGGTTTSSKPSTSATGNVVDNTGQSVKGIPAQVTTETNGTKTVTVKAADAVLFKQPNGEINSLGDIRKLSFSSVASTDSKGTVTFKPDGTIEVSNLANGTETKFDVTYDLGNGQKLVIGKIDVKMSSNGTVSLTSCLIDPYGIITDSVTGAPIDGANVTLYYANTDRNIKAGKTPDTVVPLPGIDGFKPNNNKNPQTSDKVGAYGWMVFPTSDYYIVAEKDGYYKYISPTISVEQEIVKWDFRMNKRGSQINGVNRLFGQDRIDTALSIAKAAYPNKVQNIVLASSKDFPDALGGAPLAHKLNAPLVLVGSSDAEQQKVLDFIKEKMDATGTVYILGGYGSVSSEFEGAVVSKGFKNVNRIGGADRYETSVKIAKELKVAENTPVIIANGENFADALSISSIAAMNGYPILLVQKDGMTDAVKAQLETIAQGKVFIVGLQGAVGTSVEKQITDILGTNPNLITRIGGADRYETSLEIAKYFKLDGSNICIAAGSNFPDAVAGSAYSANLNSSIILVGSELTQNQLQYLTGKKASGAAIFGGEGSVSKSIEGKILQILAR